MSNIMKLKEQVIFDIAEDKFKYLQRKNQNGLNRVDMNILHKRLNQIRKINLYSNTKVIAVSILCLGFFLLISLKL